MGTSNLSGKTVTTLSQDLGNIPKRQEAVLVKDPRPKAGEPKAPVHL